MKEIDWQEKNILQELIKNPRVSDNEISKRTRVPLKTVNRKRKKMEEDGLLYYFAYLDNSPSGTGKFSSRKLFILKLRKGITRKKLAEALSGMSQSPVLLKHIFEASIGEVDGHTAVLFTLEAEREHDISEVYNEVIVPEVERLMGDCIEETKVVGITTPIRIMRNYMPLSNISNGIISKEWPKEKVFVWD